MRFSSPAQFSHIHTMVQICMYNVILIVVTRLMFEFEFESEFCLACLASFFPSHILAAYRTKCILHFKYWQWPRKCTHINCEHIMIWLFYRDKYKHTHWNAWLNGKAVCDKCTRTRTSRREKKPLLKFATNVIVCFPHSFRVVRVRLSLYVCLRAPDIRKI